MRMASWRRAFWLQLRGTHKMSNTGPFRGWWVLSSATVGLALGYSNIGVVSFGLFVIPLADAFGWGRGDISVAMLLMNATVVVMAPLAGVLIDRLGVRRVLLPSIVLFALAVAALARLDGNILVFYLTYVLLTAFGIGTTPTTYMRTVVAWFNRKRGLAIGIAMAGVGLGATLIPPAVQFVIMHFGWRWAYLALAGLALFISLPLVAALLVEKPEDLGQLPDGRAPEIIRKDSRTWVGYSFSLCLRQRSFWLMSIGFSLLGMFTSGILAHLVPLLQDRNVSPELAALGASLLGITLIAGRIVCGLLLDRFPARLIVVGFLLGPVVGLAMLAGGASSGWAFLSVLLVGLAIGAEMDFMTYLVSRYLGLLAFGRTYGFMYSAFAVGAGFGPVLMGYAHQYSGNYGIALWGLCAATALALVPFSCLGPYPAQSIAGPSENAAVPEQETA